MQLRDRFQDFVHFLREAQARGIYPFFRPIARSWGTEVEVKGRRLVMIGSNDYLGLSHDPRVMSAAADALRRWGTGTGGSRFLSGNLTVHEELEERLAAFVGKKKAIMHVTGFSTNLGVISSLLTSGDLILFDRENHASIFEGCRASQAKLVPFPHNDFRAAAHRLARARQKHPQGISLLVTEGVFSMSGDLTPLPEIVQLKTEFPGLLIYLDDAHGLGVMGPKGQGTAAHFGLTAHVDFIMGTFSKALASIGGVIASDDELTMDYLRHHSRTLIFSAGLPASNAASVLASLDVIEQEPERVARLREISRRVRAGYQEIGLWSNDSPTPIIPILIGQEMTACSFAQDLFDHGVFALPAIYPAVPKGRAVIRTAFMSTHTESQIDFVLEVLAKLARTHQVRAVDLMDQKEFLGKTGIPRPTLQDSVGLAPEQ